jgi:hypothetical protein
MHFFPAFQPNRQYFPVFFPLPVLQFVNGCIYSAFIMAWVVLFVSVRIQRCDMTLATQTVNMDAELLKPVTFIQAIENKNTKKPDKTDQGSFAELLNERSTAINENKAEKEKSPLPGTARKADTSYQGCKEAKESNKKEVHFFEPPKKS